MYYTFKNFKSDLLESFNSFCFDYADDLKLIGLSEFRTNDHQNFRKTSNRMD